MPDNKTATNEALYMNDETVRLTINETARELGIGLRSVYRNPLKNTWYIHIHASCGSGYLEFVPGQTTEDITKQIRDLLDPANAVRSLEQVIEGLRERDRDVIYGAMQRMKSIGEPAVEPLLKILLDPSERRIVRRRAAGTLAMINDARAIAPLIHTLGDHDPKIRWSVIAALEQIGDRTAIPALQRLAETDDEEFHVYAGKISNNRSAAQKAVDRIEAREIKQS